MGDVEAQSGAGLFLSAGDGGGPAAIEDVRAVVGGDAFAVVPDLDGEAGVFAGESDFDLRTGEADGVVDEVGDDVLDGGDCPSTRCRTREGLPTM